jgi:P-type Mg2+ transporter
VNKPNQNTNSGDSSNALIDIAQKDVDGVLKLFDTTLDGLTETEAKRRLAKSGLNEIAREKPSKWHIQLLKTVTNPLSLLLIVLAIVSLLTGSPTAAPIVTIMVIFGGLLRFSQEFQSNKAAEKLRAMVSITAAVSRQDNTKATAPKEQQGITRTEIAVKLLVPGDIVFLSAGDMIPADIRLILAKDLFLGQSTLTGESLPVKSM